MYNRSFAFAAALLCLATMKVVAQDSTHRSATVPSGQQLRLSAHFNINRNCSTGAAPEVRVTTPPRHGSLSIRSGTARSPQFGSCKNVDAPARLVIYQSNRGYTGEDRVTYEVVKANGGTEAQTVTITVSPAPTSAPVNRGEKIDL